MRQVRFWIWENGGPIMLKLRKGQRVRWAQGGPHEEGFSAQARTWKFNGHMIYERWREWGRDCDGYYERGGKRRCRGGPWLSDGMSIPDLPDKNYPAWEQCEDYQRDYTAEMAGY